MSAWWWWFAAICVGICFWQMTRVSWTGEGAYWAWQIRHTAVSLVAGVIWPLTLALFTLGQFPALYRALDKMGLMKQ